MTRFYGLTEDLNPQAALRWVVSDDQGTDVARFLHEADAELFMHAIPGLCWGLDTLPQHVRDFVDAHRD